ncbi:MAG: hypothetical protein WD266_00585 [Balneolales bacterium]
MRYSVITALILFITPLLLLSSDRGDYPARPDMPFQFHHLSLELDFTSASDHTIQGIAEYEMSPKSADLQDVLLFASDMDIDLIRVDGQQVEFEQAGDSLRIQLLRASQPGEHFRVEITYEAKPDFGVHFGENGTVWSSMLPQSNRHWLPGFDHPRAEVSTTIYLRIPSEHEAVASGYFLGEEQRENGFKDVGWRSDDKIPVSEIAFVTGDLDYREIMAGSKRVRLYSEAGMLEERDYDAILDTVYDRVRETERLLLFEYPYDAYNVVALQDDRWETRPYAAGMGYIFGNRGAFTPQVAIPVYAQWFGMFQRPEQWGDASATLLYQAWLSDHFGDDVPDGPYGQTELAEGPAVYHNFSSAHLQRHRLFFTGQGEKAMVNTLKSQARKVLISGDAVMGWDEYARFWYDTSGKNWVEPPELPELEGHNYSYSYDIEVEHETMSGDLTAIIQPVNRGRDENFTVSVHLFDNEGKRLADQEFSGRGDTLSFGGTGGLENIDFGSTGGIEFNINKPFSFWLYQLRNDEDNSRRIQAALAMKDFEDEPDIQLALDGVLNREEDPEVQAAILQAMADITQGASGVQSWFLSRLDHEHPAVRKASLKALKHYSNDEIVKRDVFGIISMSDDIEMVNEGISVYRHLVPEADFLEFVDQFLSEDTDRLFTFTLINELYNTSETDFANDRVEEYLQPDNPFKIRHAAFQHLNWNDYDSDRWSERVKTYLSDHDPRIRYLMMDRLKTLPPDEQEALRSERQSKEKDVRVMN